jgi:ribosomal protein L37E
MEERKMPLNGNMTEEQHGGRPSGALDSDSNVGENMNHFTKRGACAACGGTGRTGFVHLGWQRDKRGVPHPAGCIGRLRCECDASSPEEAARLREDIALIDRYYDEWRAVEPDTLDEQMCEGCGDELVTRPQTLCPSCEGLRADRVRQEEADRRKWSAQVDELHGLLKAMTPEIDDCVDLHPVTRFVHATYREHNGEPLRKPTPAQQQYLEQGFFLLESQYLKMLQGDYAPSPRF